MMTTALIAILVMLEANSWNPRPQIAGVINTISA